MNKKEPIDVSNNENKETWVIDPRRKPTTVNLLNEYSKYK